MRFRSVTFLMLFLLISTALFAQRPRNGRSGFSNGEIIGKILDSETLAPIEYANIILHSQRDSSQITGTISDANGKFTLDGLRPGRYFLEIHFIGYEIETIGNVGIRPANPVFEVDDIILSAKTIANDAVDVVDERAAISYQIDKKVINVSKQYASAAGNAADVLKNVPSVSVDIEGNVSLRGSSSFTVLIDGRPTVLDSEDALQQIPASVIDNIEIVTNPSARYDAEGTSGIINIIMKKNKLQGSSGVVNLKGGYEDKHGGDILVSYRMGKLHAYAGADYNDRDHPGSKRAEQRTLFDEISSVSLSEGESLRGRSGSGLRGGLDLNITPKDVFSLGFRYGERTRDRGSNLNYDEWTGTGINRQSYISNNNTERSGTFFALNFNYQHIFSKKSHNLTLRADFHDRNSDELSVNELLDMDNNITSGQRSSEVGPSNRLQFNLDYVQPLGKDGKLEAGYQARFGESNDRTGLFEYDLLSGNYLEQIQFRRNTEYLRNIQAMYGMFAGKSGRLGYQAGFRAEYTDRTTSILEDNQDFIINRWDYFPTTHFSYQLREDRQLMASYTRRIVRPRSWYLEPFITWTDAYNVRQGNPGLKPTYIDSYEAGYQMPIGSSLFSSELYYRVSHNRVERVRSVYDDNVTLTAPANVGTDYALGAELMLNSDLSKWWNINLMGNLYNYKVEGVLNERSFAEENFSWNMRLNQTLKFGSTSSVQVNSRYFSNIVTAQGEMEGFFLFDLGLKQTLINKVLTATLQVEDLFGTAKHEFIYSGQDFYIYDYSNRQSPIVMLTLNYNFNNYKNERGRNGRNGDDGDDF